MADYTLAFTGPQIDAALLAAHSTQLNYNQTVPTINVSANVTSVTDSSDGDFSVNITSVYANTSYFTAVSCGDFATPNEIASVLNTNTRATDALDCCGGYVLSLYEGRSDRNSNMVQIAGTLA